MFHAQEYVLHGREITMRRHRTVGKDRRAAKLIGLLMALALVAAACGGSSDDGGAAESDETDSADESDTDDADGAEPVEEEPQAESDEVFELTMVSFLQPTTVQGTAITWYLEELEARTDGRVQVETFWAESLIAGTEIASALGDGRADFGNVTYAYTPDAFPIKTIVEIPFLSDNMPAYLATNNAMYAQNEDFRNEWENQGIKVLSFIPVPPPVTGCPEPCTDIDWFQGKSVRTSGSTTLVFDALGADPQAFPVPEVYEAMQRGLIDAYSGLILDVIAPLSLQEVGSNLIDMGIGQYASSTWTIAMDTYNSLPSDIQQVIDDLALEFPAKVIEVNDEIEDAACQTILDAGGSIYLFDDAQVAEVAEILGDRPMEQYASRVEPLGLDPEALLDEYTELLTGFEADFPSAESGMVRCLAAAG
jgi:TRAP-type transport system periplasmic protein